ncbi:MAG: glucosaminidase domain-containing protein [Bacteroidota bacterium]
MIDFNLQREAPKLHPAQIAFSWIGKYWFEVVVSLFLFQIYSNRNVQLIVDTAGIPGQSLVSQHTKVTVTDLPGTHQELSVIPSITSAVEEASKAEPVPKWKSSDFRNLTFILQPTFAERKKVGEDIVHEKLNNCRNYVKRFAKSAMIEKEKYGIPASITLAQGLLESDAGDSRLAKESNNHFGIKCRAKCRGCTCRNYSDDDIYDMFRVFDSAWESFREHSLLLQISRYSHLKKLGTKDYRNWAIGLKKAGYATDKNYHKKLIRIIEELDLQQFDQ